MTGNDDEGSEGDDAASHKTLDEILQSAIKAVTDYGPLSIDNLLDRIGERVFAGEDARAESVVALMRACKHARGFKQMLEIAEVFEGLDDPELPLLQCQARIDTGQHRAAIIKLKRQLPIFEELADEKRRNKSKSEALGLLGRAYKQQFVERIGVGDTDEAAKALRRSVDYYNTAYPLDPAWHGANLAALSWRAERENISLEINARDIGERLLSKLGTKANPNYWTVSALAQAFMAQDDWESGLSRYEEYFRRLRRCKGTSAAFTLYGDIRQLVEIWLADSGQVSGTANIIEMLRERMARTALPGCSSDEVNQLLDAIGAIGVDPEETLEAMVTSGDIIPVEEMWRVIENRHKVAKITNSDGSPKGTGFLLDARPFGVTDTHAVLVTNNHVVAKEPTIESQIVPDEARVEFESWDSGLPTRFKISKVLAESPNRDHDVTIAVLKNLPECAKPAKLKNPEERFLNPRNAGGPLGRVHPIGHPDGGPLSLSLAGNEVVDHDLFKGPRGVRRVHYKANTRSGNSGGPVFGKSGYVVAVHRATTKRQIDGTPISHEPDYAANEGIGIGCIVSWLQER